MFKVVNHKTGVLDSTWNSAWFARMRADNLNAGIHDWFAQFVVVRS